MSCVPLTDSSIVAESNIFVEHAVYSVHVLYKRVLHSCVQYSVMTALTQSDQLLWCSPSPCVMHQTSRCVERPVPNTMLNLDVVTVSEDFFLHDKQKLPFEITADTKHATYSMCR